MKKSDYFQHWNYFCSLAALLEETKNYVYHGIDEPEEGKKTLIHGKVYSDKFKQIIILASSEFEVVSKALCLTRGKSAKNIVEISRALLCMFPKIVETEITTIFATSCPLANWKVIDNDGKKVKGLGWWYSYNAIKHDAINSYKEATLENAIAALSVLYIVNLYLMYTYFDSLALSYYFPPSYFKNKYSAASMTTGDGLLPDFGNKTPYERANEIIHNIRKS